MTAEQTLRLFVKGLPERKGIEKNLWAKKFIKAIKYSKEEVSVTLYYKSIFGEKDFVGNGRGRPHPASAISVGFPKEKSPTKSEASFNLAPRRGLEPRT